MLAQATWRHVLFAVVLGVLEERLNQGFRVDVPEVPVSSNGHGDIEFAVGAATYSADTDQAAPSAGGAHMLRGITANSYIGARAKLQVRQAQA